jgi:hypothetical protein
MSDEAPEPFVAKDGLTFYDVVRITEACEEPELRGLYGYLAGHSWLPDDLDWAVFVEGPDRVWCLRREEFEPTGERLRREDVQSGVRLRVSVDGDLLGVYAVSKKS